VDTLGLVRAVVVHAANIQDRDGATLVLARMQGRFPRLLKVWAAGAYAGGLIAWTQALLGCILEIVKRSDDQKGFVVLPKRWIVERTFAWFGRYRRLSKDDEELPASSETMIYIAMIHLMLRRLAPPQRVCTQALRAPACSVQRDRFKTTLALSPHRRVRCTPGHGFRQTPPEQVYIVDGHRVPSKKARDLGDEARMSCLEPQNTR